MRIVAIAGAIGSGKSELSRALANEFGAARVSFGDFVRGEAEVRGIESTRENLQELGEQLIDEWGAPELVRRVLAEWPRADLVVTDGVRHLAVARRSEESRSSTCCSSSKSTTRRAAGALRSGKAATPGSRHSISIQQSTMCPSCGQGR